MFLFHEYKFQGRSKLLVVKLKYLSLSSKNRKKLRGKCRDHKIRQYQEFSCQLCVHRACDVLITVVPYVFPVSSDVILKSLKNGIISFWGSFYMEM